MFKPIIAWRRDFQKSAGKYAAASVVEEPPGISGTDRKKTEQRREHKFAGKYAGRETPAGRQNHTAAAIRRRNELRELELRTLAAERNSRRRLEDR